MEDPFFSHREGVGGESADDAQKSVEDAQEILEDGVTKPPDWLLDGWIWEVRHGDFC